MTQPYRNLPAVHPSCVRYFPPAPRPRCCWRRWPGPRRTPGKSGGEPDGIVQVANLVYAGTKSSRCFSDHFLIKAEKEIVHLDQPPLPCREARQRQRSTSFPW